MFRSIRALVLVATLVGASLTMIIGWATGVIQAGVERVTSTWADVSTWINSPSLGDIPSQLGAILLPVLVVMVAFAMLSGN